VTVFFRAKDLHGREIVVSDTSRDTLIRHGTPEFRRITLALFSAGFATFALLYCVQPLMPVFARDFNISAAQSSLSLSLTTALLAPAMIVAGAVSETRGRKSIMVTSLFVSAALMFLSAFARRWETFVGARALVGITFAGLPAVSMAYLSEEVHPQSIGLAMGLTIGGNGLGGMFGRLMASSIADALSWRYSIAAIGALGLVATFIFWHALPPSRHFTPRPLRVGALLKSFWDQLCDGRLMPLYAEGFLLMGSFVTAYNYITYHLLAPPYSLSQTVVGSIFVVYPVGIFASAWIGSLAGRAGRGPDADVDARADAHRRCHDTARIARLRHHRNRDAHVRILCRSFGGQRVGRSASDAREGAGGRAVSVLLLHGLERCRLSRRSVLGSRLVAWRRRVRRDDARRRAVHCPPAAARPGYGPCHSTWLIIHRPLYFPNSR